MSRKDTIIIAVLINAGLLALLFMMAINTNDDSVKDNTEVSQTLAVNQHVSPSPASVNSSTPISIPLPIVIADASVADEVDNFLKDLNTNDLSQANILDEDGMVELEADAPVSTYPVSSNTLVLEENKIPPDSRFVEVTVKRGDALEKIAKSNGTTIEVIKKVNNLATTKLKIGQVLRIPLPEKNIAQQSTNSPKSAANGSSGSKIVAETKPPSSQDVQYYTIKSGDNPWKIARQFQVKFDDLLKLNGLDEEKARNLKVGDRIRVK